jgi:hypothetical protein
VSLTRVDHHAPPASRTWSGRDAAGAARSTHPAVLGCFQPPDPDVGPAPGGGEPLQEGQGSTLLLAVRGGCWFTRGGGELHVGIEESFVLARTAHPAFDVGADLDAVASLVVETGAVVAWADLEEWAGSHLAGLRRLHSHDPVGDRVGLVGR